MANKNTKKQKPQQKPLSQEASAIRTRRIVIITLSVILSLAVVLGAVLGIITAVRNSSYIMTLDRVGIDEGVASFLISIYKYDYMVALLESGVEAEDTSEFWSTPLYTGNQGDLFNYEAERYLKSIIAANALFDEYATLTAADKSKIAFAVEEVLGRKASGDKKAFNELTKEMGFDYKDFEKGSEMLYKMRVVYNTVFGESGSKMQTSFADYCESFYNKNYIKAKILIIRTQDTYELDESGNMIKGEDGKYKTRPLKEAEKLERANYISELDACVESIRNNPNNTISLNDFNNLLEEIANKYKENVVSGVTDGYYLASGSEYSSLLGIDDVISKAFSLEIGEIYTNETGALMSDDEEDNDSFSYKCYVYKMEKEDKAYKNKSLEHFFRDFNSLASVSLYSEIVDAYSKDVEVKDDWKNINPVAIPYNYNYRVNTFE